ncbi:FadR/GntR family transcriptional regulator [Amnibacterium kyonggiense]|uniref:GntR family transcriptional regulator n=1 Tax=Amnibacterium kyonggiense TaxID=595671 RepID=A0A4R7FGM0_9MICO|nr:GntR family transcriptional regulator [Amnibacterium kyonggiense]TDS75855.1 GntR family transcriptional regulator [Amnibacterium kyonggiense]
MPKESTPLVAQISDRLITAIATGEFLPGSRLPAERDLAGLLHVGRTSVRAALAVLHERGLIETQRGRGGGSFVRVQWTPDSHAAVARTLQSRWSDIQDRLEAMRRLHGAIARAAAESRSDDDVALLQRRLDEYRDAASGRGKQIADASLHLAISDAAKNGTLKSMLLTLEQEISIGAPLHVWGEPDGMLAAEDRGLREHELLVAAIVEGRADDADEIAREHARIDLELLEVARQRAERAAAAPEGRE